MSRASFRTHVLLPYGFAILCTVIATWLRCALTPLVGDRVPFGCFFGSVIVSAWVGGVGPAIVSLALGIVCAAHFIIPPEGSLLVQSPSDLFSLTIYFLVGVASIGLFFQVASRTQDAERQLEENRRLSEALQLTDRRKDEFLAMLAHELRNPLAPIRSGLALLCRMCDADSRAVELTAVLNRQISHISYIVNDLLDVSRFIRDELTLSCEVLDIRTVVNDARDAVTGEMKSKKHRFNVTVADSSALVLGDRVRLVQILTNLLLNAAKYTPEGGRIQLFTHATQDTVQLEVRDNGIGIDPDCQPRVFELFAQLNPVATREQGGLGLGLAIVRALTEKHGGTVTVASEGRGLGSQFVVELPRHHETEASPMHDHDDIRDMAENDTSDADSGSPETAPAPLVVYIVDDNQDASVTMAMLLQLDGYEVHCFDDGPTAIQAVSDSPPDAILLDIGLPGMDGYEVARRIRRLRYGADILILACTGWGSPTDIQNSVDAGIDEHLVKPVDPPRISALLAQLTQHAA